MHYYEDGNVRLQTEKPVSASVASSPSAADIVKQIAILEKKYQEDLNRAFVTLSEGAFKNLRRQLPVTRQKVEWEKISGYRVCRLFPCMIVADLSLAGTRHWRRKKSIAKR